MSAVVDVMQFDDHLPEILNAPETDNHGRRTGSSIARTCEGLRNEQHLYAEKAGPYACLKPEAAHRLLAKRTSSLIMAEHAKWAHAREAKTETTGAF